MSTQKGGAGRGQGRKPIKQGEETVTLSIRLTVAQREKLEQLGGAAWIRDRIDAERNLVQGVDLIDVCSRFKICRWKQRAGSIPASGTSIHAACSVFDTGRKASQFRGRSASTAMHVPHLLASATRKPARN